MSHNSRFMALIKDVTARVDTARNKADLLDAIRQVRAFEGKLAFDHTRPFLVAGLGAILLGLAGWLFWRVPDWEPFWIAGRIRIEPAFLPVGAAILGGICAVSSLVFIRNRANLLPDLSGRIARFSSYFTHGLSPVDPNAGNLLECLMGEFADYRRGNHSREMREVLAGSYAGARHRLNYGYHHLHYVNVRVETHTVSNGRGGVRTVRRKVYDHFDRYSLVLDFPWVRDVAVRSDGAGGIDRERRWETASTDFNRAFVLSGATEIACVRFAKPVTVLLLLEMREHLRKMNLDFSRQGRLCLGFDDDDLLGYEIGRGLAEPERFHEIIGKGVDLPRLLAVLALIHKLAEQHDDNFSAPDVPEPPQEQ